MKIKDVIALKFSPSITKFENLSLIWRTRSHDLLGLLIMTISALVYIPLRGVIIQTLPFLSVLFAFNIYLLPGMAIATLLARDETWIERLPIAMIMSQVLLSIPGVLVMGLQSNMGVYIWIFIVLTALCLILATIVLIRTGRIITSEQTDAISLPILAILIIGIVALFYISKHMPLIGDDWVAMPWFWQFLTSNHIMSSFPYHEVEVPTNVRQEFGVLALNVAMVNYIAGLEPINFYLIFPFCRHCCLISHIFSCEKHLQKPPFRRICY